MRRSSCLTRSLRSGARSGCVLRLAHFAASAYTLHDARVVALRGFSTSTPPAFSSHGFGCVQQEQRSKSERASLRKAEAAIAARLAAAQEQWLQEKEDLDRSLQESRWGLRERQTGACPLWPPARWVALVVTLLEILATQAVCMHTLCSAGAGRPALGG